ncbi:AraC family transcriptional regulator [Vreelandella venusta]|uniref:AraC family transcriptional regulator n=1 Tax=Vreelandella venusta TaxID=44935 RepID=A0AAP9ZGK9_9GAMM|nr:AraC family transcriptional regulator [Halomonas venusta]MBR9926842.1 helix-turn-helix transcriptional regulator [Gammaproteobacteria bacterium]AZM95455.1 AraC family transcriptional regulator [Halomonas venusta]NPT32728.1 AraC family transcriptional regulator [Halomonas venusta]QRL04608.1 helix-turn-helix domain-containing protein [Halomonas venusta]UQI42058.1 AraC family transcriptional regulator [Halomonas venusta]
MPSTIRQIPLESATKHHSHDFHQIVITLCGSSEFEIEGLGGRINAFSGCIVPANHEHFYSGSGYNRQLILDLPEDAPALTGEHRELVALFDAPRFFALDNPLRHYLAFVESELAQGFDTLAMSFQQDRLAATLLGSLKARLGAPESASQRRLNLDQIDRFIRRHLADELRVADLAKLACLSEAHFSERFRVQTGLSPWQYVRRQRLHAARQLVLQSRLPLTDIAIQTGFANQSALSHAFRRNYGLSPRQLRQGVGATNTPLDSANQLTPSSISCATSLASSATSSGASVKTSALSSR